MPTARTHQPGRFLWALALCLSFATLSRAEDTTATTTTFSAPTPIDQGSPPKQSEDRQQSSRRAKDALGALSGFQQMSCFMLMGIATASGDPMTMAMAMQQCLQAQETEKSRKENEDTERKLAGWEPGKAPTMKVTEMKTPTAPKDERLLPGLEDTRTLTETADAPSPDPQITPVAAPKFARQEQKTEEPPAPAVTLPDPKSSVPAPIARAKLGYDESGAAGKSPTPSRELGPASSVATAKPDERAPEDTALREQIGDKGLSRMERRLLGGTQFSIAADSSSGSSAAVQDSLKDMDSFDAMLLALRGEAAAPVPQSGDEVLALPGNEEEEINIFQYATYRYRRIGTVEKKIRIQSERGEIPPTSVAAHEIPVR